tara:strand:+ start:55 stop:792 length:738 start_codon:yes stop_codon:yes gene_type:complete
MTNSNFFIVGKHPVTEALKNTKRKVLRVFLTEESKKSINRENQNRNLLKDIKVFFKTKKELDKYCKNEQILHQGYVAEIEPLINGSLKEFITSKKNITFACLQNVTDPRNIGSVIRSAASFEIDGLIVQERLFPETSKTMYKASSGAVEHINIFKVSNINSTLKYLREKNFWVYGFDNNSKDSFTEKEWKGNNVLLFGSEGFGLNQKTEKYVDFFVRINISNKIDSLNISNSAAIVFHHLSSQKK